MRAGSTKYESGTGWPSFFEAVPGSVIERQDPEDLADKRRAMMMGGVRVEVPSNDWWRVVGGG